MNNNTNKCSTCGKAKDETLNCSNPFHLTPTPNEAIEALLKDLNEHRLNCTQWWEDCSEVDNTVQAITNLLLEARIDEIDTALNLNLTGKIWVGVKEKDNLRTFLEERRKDLKKEIKE